MSALEGVKAVFHVPRDATATKHGKDLRKATVRHSARRRCHPPRLHGCSPTRGPTYPRLTRGWCVLRSQLAHTKNLLEACSTMGVQRLVVIVNGDIAFGGKPLAGADESTPAPSAFLCVSTTHAVHAACCIARAHTSLAAPLASLCELMLAARC